MLLRKATRSLASRTGGLRHLHAAYLLIIIGLGVSIGACVDHATRPALNSDRIRQTFGSYGVNVLSSDKTRRISSLYSGAGSEKVTRTYAVVDFVSPMPAPLTAEHARVESGQSIGEVFRNAGWTIEKRHQFIGEFNIPATYAEIAELMHVTLPKDLATDVYYFAVRHGDASYNYAMITEIHHPDYLSATDLKALYGEILFDNSGPRNIGDYIGPATSQR